MSRWLPGQSRRSVVGLRLRLLRALLLSGLFGCASARQVTSGMISPETTQNHVLLRVSDGPLLTLKGEAALELSRLPGAQVKLEGHPQGKSGTFWVDGYLILDAGEGVMPHVGILRWNATELVLMQGPGQPVVTLSGDQSEAMRSLLGARIWVVGVIIGDDTLSVIRYGLLRSASEMKVE